MRRAMLSVVLVASFTTGEALQAKDEHILYLPITQPAGTTPPKPSPTPPLSAVINCKNFVPRGSFEYHHTGWLAWEKLGTEPLAGVPVRTIITRGPRAARSGNYGALLGAKRDVLHLLMVDQMVPTRPLDRGRAGDLIGGKLSFWMKAIASNWDNAGRRYLEVYLESLGGGYIKRARIARFENVDASEGRWKQYEYVVTPLLVRRESWEYGARLVFRAETRGNAYTAWMVDDVSLDICYRRE